VVHGHQVTDLAATQGSLRQNSTVIPLDNGCCFASMASEYKKLNNVTIGNLCCLDLDTLELTVQPNVEFAFEASA
jgi:hypothetical protein